MSSGGGGGMFGMLCLIEVQIKLLDTDIGIKTVVYRGGSDGKIYIPVYPSVYLF